jgi:signal peptidase I
VTRLHRLWVVAVKAFWLVVIPAALVALVVRYGVPSPVAGERAGGVMSAIARAGSRAPVPFAVALFVLFSSLVRYWRAFLAGRRRLASPDMPLVDVPSRPRARGWVVAGFAIVAVVAGASALVVRASLFESYRVSSDSMLPTLEPGDDIGASKLGVGPTRTPARGEVIVFRNATGAGPAHLVKRVIGVPGDRITMRGSHPIINGWEVPSCDAGTYLYALHDGGAVKGRLLVEFLEDDVYLTLHTPITRAFDDAYEVKSGELFVLGDNRNNSSDSRAWNDGHGAGVALGTLAARARWRLLGVHRSGTVDYSRLFKGLDLRPHLDGVDVRPLEEGIARCLNDRPKNTHPPAPGAPGI